MRPSIKLIAVTAFIFIAFSCASATDLFVRPQGCAYNVRLVMEDSYRQLVNFTIDQCAATCLADGVWCRSFSYYDNPSNWTKVCDLNLGHSDSLWTGLRYAQFWTYYERITEITGIKNYGIANISTCTPNTYRDCRTAYLSSNIGTTRQIWLKLDNLSYIIPAYCQYGAELLAMQRSGIGFYDISWNRKWEDYKYGFGRDIKNFWMGLDFMYRVINQDVILRWSGGIQRCIFPRKINGTTERFTLSDTLANRCPWWSIRSDGKLVMSLRSLCICEDNLNPTGTGHVQLCGCNQPKRYPFVWSPLTNQILSKRPRGGSRCLRINADSGGEEVAVADCNQADPLQTWVLQQGRYRNYWASWDITNVFRDAVGVHTQMENEELSYRMYGNQITGSACLSCKGLDRDSGQFFSTYDNDFDDESTYNVALREAGGDWWTSWSGGLSGSSPSDPKFTGQKDVSHFSFASKWLMNAYLSLPADDFWI